MPDKPIKLIRTDLDAAREAWIKEARSDEARSERRQSYFLAYRDGAGRVVDFHALRHTYISRLVASGANIKVAQELARHSTPTLTLGRYAHIQLVDQTRALDALPAIETTCPDRQTAKATGTDDVAASSAASECAAPGAARRVPDTAKLAITGQDGEAQEDDAEGAQTPAKATTYAHLSTRVIGAPGQTRTGNLRIRSPRLYPLSYGRK